MSPAPHAPCGGQHCPVVAMLLAPRSNPLPSHCHIPFPCPLPVSAHRAPMSPPLPRSPGHGRRPEAGRFACFASISCSLFTSFLSFCWCASCSCLLRLRLRLVFMPGASPDWMAGGGGAVETSANNGDGGFVELRALCCCSNGAYSQALGMLASPSTSRAASSPCEMADLPIVAL